MGDNFWPDFSSVSLVCLEKRSQELFFWKKQMGIYNDVHISHCDGQNNHTMTYQRDMLGNMSHINKQMRDYTILNSWIRQNPNISFILESGRLQFLEERHYSFNSPNNKKLNRAKTDIFLFFWFQTKKTTKKPIWIYPPWNWQQNPWKLMVGSDDSCPF